MRAGSYPCECNSVAPDLAAAQQMQGGEDHKDLVRRLEAKYHEQRAEVGTNQYGWLIELFESADGETWTLVATRPGRPSCVFGVGDHWQLITPGIALLVHRNAEAPVPLIFLAI